MTQQSTETPADTATGTVFDIQKFSIHDGPGIRTTVFLKGCTLSCAWCHNPESQERTPEISFLPDKCIGCGYCVKVCVNGCHDIENDTHVFVRDDCERCGKCAGECYAGALEQVGNEMSIADVISEVEKDRPFYDESGGGMTISGGEPLAQSSFSIALLAEAKRRGLHTCVETCGHGSGRALAEMAKLVDIFLFDFKESDRVRHQEYTGVPNDLILENLQQLHELGADIFLRCPIIPGVNDRDEHLAAIAELANRTSSIKKIDVLPYHPLGKSKSLNIGKEYALGDEPFAEEDDADRWVAFIQERTKTPVSRN